MRGDRQQQRLFQQDDEGGEESIYALLPQEQHVLPKPRMYRSKVHCLHCGAVLVNVGSVDVGSGARPPHTPPLQSRQQCAPTTHVPALHLHCSRVPQHVPAAGGQAKSPLRPAATMGRPLVSMLQRTCRTSS